jgi:excinuclease ABC subunit C
MIREGIFIKNNELPENPGVYFYYDAAGKLLYIGKATSLRKRVGSYFTKAHDARIEDLVRNIVRIDYIETPTVIEALVLEANQIRTHQPPYNIMEKDDKSFLYFCLTNEIYPRPVLLRGRDLERLGIQPFSRKLSEKAKRYFLAVYGPYTNGRAIKLALDLLRPVMPWSVCVPPGGSDFPLELFTGQRSFGFKKGSKDGRPCFDAQIKRCPGVCSGALSARAYRRGIAQLMRFFEGKKTSVLHQLERGMKIAAREHRFEEAAAYRNKVQALEHINDVALILRDDDVPTLPFSRVEGVTGANIMGRIEAYDIAHISGSAAVASMVVFENGRAAKELYRRFKIKVAQGGDDVASMEEVLRRRLARAQKQPVAWPLPDLLVIDGGEGQVNRIQDVVESLGVNVPVIGIAKGFDRKQDRLVSVVRQPEVLRAANAYKEVLQRARDEAHRFAGAYHRILRARNSGIPKKGEVKK